MGKKIWRTQTSHTRVVYVPETQAQAQVVGSLLESSSGCCSAHSLIRQRVCPYIVHLNRWIDHELCRSKKICCSCYPYLSPQAQAKGPVYSPSSIRNFVEFRLNNFSQGGVSLSKEFKHTYPSDLNSLYAGKNGGGYMFVRRISLYVLEMFFL